MENLSENKYVILQLKIHLEEIRVDSEGNKEYIQHIKSLAKVEECHLLQKEEYFNSIVDYIKNLDKWYMNALVVEIWFEFFIKNIDPNTPIRLIKTIKNIGKVKSPSLTTNQSFNHLNNLDIPLNRQYLS